MQEQIPSLRDGFDVQPISQITRNVVIPGSPNPHIETGMWSAVRRPLEGLQEFGQLKGGNQAVWLLYSNEHESVDYDLGCASEHSIISPFPPGTVAKNLFFPFQEYEIQGLKDSKQIGSYGCVDRLSLPPFAFMALVPKENFVVPTPSITHFSPGHDARILSSQRTGHPEPIEIELHFSTEMNCGSVAESISIHSKTEKSGLAFIDELSIKCGLLQKSRKVPTILSTQPEGVWFFSATLRNMHDGVHRLTVNNATSMSGTSWTMAKDHFLLRIGKHDNPVVFPFRANYTQGLIQQAKDDIFISHRASGADLFRYSMDWGVHYTDWQPYFGGQTHINMSTVDTRREHGKTGRHVVVQYWSKFAGSSNHIQHGDLASDLQSLPIRRLPHIYPQGPFNKFGYETYSGDLGMQQQRDGTWTYPYMDEWPSSFFLNVCKFSL